MKWSALPGLLILVLSCSSANGERPSGLDGHEFVQLTSGSDCQEWRDWVLDWVEQGNSLFEARGPRKISADVPVHRDISLSEAVEHCGAGFPLGVIAPDNVTPPVKYSIGDGAENVLPGRYEYRWSGGKKVDGLCKVILNNDKYGLEGGYIQGEAIYLPLGQEFTITLRMSDSPISFSNARAHGDDADYLLGGGPLCRGLLVRVGPVPPIPWYCDDAASWQSCVSPTPISESRG